MYYEVYLPMWKGVNNSGANIRCQCKTKDFILHSAVALRDEQIKLNIENVKGRIESHEKEKRDDPIALVGYGGSINDTWKDIKDYKYIFSCFIIVVKFQT